MSKKSFRCRLCYINDSGASSVQDMDSFVNHLIDQHNSYKIKEMLVTLETFGIKKEKINNE